MNFKSIPLLKILCWIPAIALLQSCTNGFMLVERTKSFSSKKSFKVVSIEPDYTLIKAQSKDIHSEFTKNESEEAEFSKTLSANAKKTKVDLVLVDANQLKEDNTDYFNYLLPLKRAILQANMQQVSTYEGSKKKKSFFKIGEKTMKRSPSIPSKFSHLSKIYGTPLFCVYGLINIEKGVGMKKAHSIFYLFVVNVEDGETVYRELRMMDALIKKDMIDIIAYDSFKILKR